MRKIFLVLIVLLANSGGILFGMKEKRGKYFYGSASESLVDICLKKSAELADNNPSFGEQAKAILPTGLFYRLEKIKFRNQNGWNKGVFEVNQQGMPGVSGVHVYSSKYNFGVGLTPVYVNNNFTDGVKLTQFDTKNQKKISCHKGSNYLNNYSGYAEQSKMVLHPRQDQESIANIALHPELPEFATIGNKGELICWKNFLDDSNKITENSPPEEVYLENQEEDQAGPRKSRNLVCYSPNGNYLAALVNGSYNNASKASLLVYRSSGSSRYEKVHHAEVPENNKVLSIGINNNGRFMAFVEQNRVQNKIRNNLTVLDIKQGKKIGSVEAPIKDLSRFCLAEYQKKLCDISVANVLRYSLLHINDDATQVRVSHSSNGQDYGVFYVGGSQK